MRTVGTTFAIIVLGLLGFMAWLLWPLPDTQFDWEYIADEMIAQGDCRFFGPLVYGAAVADPDAFNSDFGADDLRAWCPTIDDREIAPGVLPSDYFADEIDAHLEFNVAHSRTQPSFLNGLRDGLSFWTQGRAVGGRSALGFWRGMILSWA